LTLSKNPSLARLKRDFTRFAVSKIEMKSQRATANAAERKRSRSGLTRGGELGRALGFVCSSGAKTGYGFRTALG